jgi:hypothetical protein
MTTIKARYMRAVLVAIVGSVLLLARVRSQARAGSITVIEGTGNFSSVVLRTTQTLNPPCVSLVTRTGNIAFTGFITNALQDGDFVSHNLRDACATPVQGTSRQTYDLLNATVAGNTGDLVVEVEGIFEGDATAPPGARTRYHLKIRGVGGDFKGAEGEGQSVGLATAFPSLPADSSDTYYVKIWFKK